MCISKNFNSKNIENVFENNVFNQNLLIKEIVKLLFAETLKNGKFESYVLLGDGTNAKEIKGNQKDFDEKIDNGTIKIKKDYFRIDQNMNIGWYIE